MGYRSKKGRRPDENASRASHIHVINDPTVKSFLENCTLPKRAADVSLDDHEQWAFEPVSPNPIRQIIAIDGGYQEIMVQTEFPSSTICFLQFGALIFNVDDLEELETQPFIDPDDMAKLKQIQRLKLTLPTRNITSHNQPTLTHSVRRALYDFFLQPIDNDRLIETLRWFIFEEYHAPRPDEWTLATCPHCDATSIPLNRASMTKTFTFQCPSCNGELYLTDVLRLHEAVDDEQGAGGILGYVTTSIEQLILVHLIRIILKTKPSLLGQIQFIKDGPLAFFGQTANMHKPMRALVRFLLANHTLFLAGLEKSGAFVDHADEVEPRLEPGTVLALDNEYIYRYIIPGKADPSNPYGRTTYYSTKLIFKTERSEMYVVSLPTADQLLDPKRTDLANVDTILTNVAKLHCDMYDNALVPIALVNKLVSLANHPSSRILQRFAMGSIT